jgi:hypothetical protein
MHVTRAGRGPDLPIRSAPVTYRIGECQVQRVWGMSGSENVLMVMLALLGRGNFLIPD